MKRSWTPLRTLLAAVAVAAFAAVTLSPQDADASTAGETGAMKFSRSELAASQAELDAGERIPGTTWGVDPRVGRVVVTADPTVRGAKLARLERVAGRHGGKVVLRRSAARLTRFLDGGEGVQGAGTRCSLGFNVTRPGKPAGFLTAGHCGNAVPTWSATQGGPSFARTESSVFPAHDHALAVYTDSTAAHPGAVDLHDGTTQAITGARDAAVGETVRRSGSTTGVRSGVVRRTGVTVNYPEGRVMGLTETDACAEPGDSGGPFFSGTDALGLLSGGSGDCAAGGTTFFQPVKEALAVYGAELGRS
ncbi:S1 family peptidase [Streptomyces eurocidicus]|uniref:Streptogrisin D n=1 Tax=Streptomyces eurocidicus TaxID=66423 RepID=A0A7W8F465_STREU|nr:S1 family peptidase [Streptomyces eurocidicus]MBB5120724.1 streptogrisin D [Streptomyces eurocidicus]